jgi:beta-glucosidase
MKKTITLALAAMLGIASATAIKPAITPDPKMEREIDKIVSKMTLDEKVGQMCELTIDVISDMSNTDAFAFDFAKLEWAKNDVKVGSILNVPHNEAQSLDVWHYTLKTIQDASLKYQNIPDLYGVDQIHGTTYTVGGTLFPQEVNMAASFNRELVRRAGQISAYETKAGSIPWIYAPVMDLGRDSRWPRMWESFGEDAYLNGQMATELVLGYQGDDPNHIGANSVAACAKHFMGYGMPVSGKDRTPSSITLQDMREKHFYPFKKAVQAGVLSVMVNSANNNGMPFHCNAELLTQWLKTDLNWDGMIVTDWADIINIWKRDHVAKDYKEAIQLAINAGIDMSMTPYDADFCTLLKELVQEGKVPMSRIDDAVKRIIRIKKRCNLWKQPYTEIKDYPKFGSAEHSAVALQLAEEAEVLLKNDDNILPLKQGTKILVTGPTANSMRSLNGGWSYAWQGSANGKFHDQYNTIYEALANVFGSNNVKLEQGVQFNEEGNWFDELAPEIDKAVAAAADVDVIVACVGENSYCETPGNLTDLTLSPNQLNLVKALAETGKPIILVLNEGRPRIISQIEPIAKAVVGVWLPGNYGGDALANLMAGKANFSAKMPFTYPRLINSLATYDYKPCENVATMDGNYNYDAIMDVQWQFGHGLSYTTYAYSNLTVDKTSFAAGDTLHFTIDVTNTGSVAGKEPILLYSSDLVASCTPDIKRLRAFTKIELAPGETKTVSLEIPANDLAFVGYDGKWRLEDGDFVFRCGNQNVLSVCSDTKVWDEPVIE